MKKIVMLLAILICCTDMAVAQSNAKQRIAEFNRTDKSDWVIKYYVDDFDEATDIPYITTNHLITGVFSNSATRDSDLRVKVLFDLNDGLMFEFYEYSWGSTPYTPFLFMQNAEVYSVLIQDGKGIRHTVRAAINDNAYRFYFTNSTEVLNYLLAGGTVKFLFREENNEIHSYRFDIEDTKGFEAAYKALSGRVN